MQESLTGSILAALPGAVGAGVGAAFCAFGYRLVRVYSVAFGIGTMAALGCVLGALTGAPMLAGLCCAAGAAAGYALGPVFAFVYPAVAAALGGFTLGQLLVIWLDFNHPQAIPLALGAGFALIAAMNVRLITIVWTSLVGGAVATAGIAAAMESPSGTAGWLAATPQLFLAYAVFLVGGMAFQFRTTREESIPTRVARPAVKPDPAPTA